VYVDGEAVPDWNYCHETCNPVPSSTLSSAPVCPSGQRCSVIFSGSTVCSAVNSGAGGMASRCTDNDECQSGLYCNSSGHCTASCWVDDDTCSTFVSGYGCRTYVTPVVIDGNEIGACLPSQASSGCKEECDSDADCTVIGTRCISTTNGDICLNEQCEECFDLALSCVSDNSTCLFEECGT
jgi:hypothetical protein